MGTIYARSQSHTCWQGTGSFRLFAIYISSLPHGIILRAPHLVTAGLNQQGACNRGCVGGRPQSVRNDLKKQCFILPTTLYLLRVSHSIQPTFRKTGFARMQIPKGQDHSGPLQLEFITCSINIFLEICEPNFLVPIQL